LNYETILPSLPNGTERNFLLKSTLTLPPFFKKRRELFPLLLSIRRGTVSPLFVKERLGGIYSKTHLYPPLRKEDNPLKQ